MGAPAGAVRRGWWVAAVLIAEAVGAGAVRAQSVEPASPPVKAAAASAPSDAPDLPDPAREVLVNLHASNLAAVAAANVARSRAAHREVRAFAHAWRARRLKLDRELMVLLHELDVPQAQIATPAAGLVTGFLRAPETERLFRDKKAAFDKEFLAKAASMQTDDLDRIRTELTQTSAIPPSLTTFLREAAKIAEESRSEAERLQAGINEKDKGTQ